MCINKIHLCVPAFAVTQSVAIIFVLCLTLYPYLVHSQSSPYVPNEYLVQLKKGVDIFSLTEDHQKFKGKESRLRPVKLISPPFNIWQIRYNKNEDIDHIEFLNEISKNYKVAVAQVNHKLNYRATVPNDPGFSSQWQYINNGSNGGVLDADLDADDAWDITTGGVTILGDTIVVAIIDDGINLNHPDWGDNLWVNRFEIPGNNVDDDNNGYMDDYLGWDADFNNDNIADGGWHGTPLAGIIGAKGNNNIGVTGVNWNVKMMIIQGGGDEAQAITAYTYALVQRRIYNRTNGAMGAFVVATNSSWGLDFEHPSSAPLWCAFYDSLGAEGILNAGATTNSNANVDVVGDLPTTCPSDFLISTTNVGRNGFKVNAAGYGATSIDLGAFGDDTWTLNNSGGYSAFGGTSAAAPHVAGAIGLLYAAPCPSLNLLAKTDPAQAALLVRQYILDGVEPHVSLAGITVTGGRLNLHNAMTELMNNCIAIPCVQPFSIFHTSLTGTSVSLKWSALSASSFNIRYRQTGGSWNNMQVSSDTVTIFGLATCTGYEFQVESICGSDSSGYAATYIFTTDGCCVAPSNLSSSALTDSSVVLHWNRVLAALSYNIRYRSVSSSSWMTLPAVTTDSITLTNLSSCTGYEFQVQTICIADTTHYSTNHKFNTPDCGNCVDLNYCPSLGDTEYEWIETVEIGPLVNNSGNNGGYGNFTSSTTTFVKGTNYPFTLTPGYFIPDDQFFVVWIDFNQDGDFNDPGEMVFNSGFASANPVTGNITISPIAQSGNTRLRVSMQWNNVPNPCDASIFIFGEVEDYCITIIDSVSCIEPVANFNYSTSLLSATFSDASTNALHWKWLLDDGHTDTIQNPVHTFADTGQYNVCLIATNDCGSDTSCQVISVACPLPVSNFTSTDSLLSVSFINQSVNGLNSGWIFGDGTTDTLPNPVHVYDSAGSYNVCLITDNACGKDTFCSEINLSCPLPAANFTNADSSLQVSFFDMTPDAISWQWAFGDGAVSTLPNPRHTYALPGLYIPCLTVGNYCGKSKLCDSIYVSLTSLVDNTMQQGLLISPNPFYDKTTIYFPCSHQDTYRLTLYNAVGRLVKQINEVSNGKVEINRGFLNSGLYFFQLRSNNGIIVHGKIILQ